MNEILDIKQKIQIRLGEAVVTCIIVAQSNIKIACSYNILNLLVCSFTTIMSSFRLTGLGIYHSQPYGQRQRRRGDLDFPPVKNNKYGILSIHVMGSIFQILFIFLPFQIKKPKNILKRTILLLIDDQQTIFSLLKTKS